jgi:citrate lyase beta subunit
MLNQGLKSPRRSWLLCLPLDQRKLDKAIGSQADVLMLDLEDGATPENKDAAREKVRALAQSSGTLGQHEVFVRVNSLFTPWGYADVEAACGLPIDGIVYPMVRSDEELWQVRRMLDEAGSAAEIAIIAETPQAILNIRDIARVRGVTTLMHGPGDLSVETKIHIDDRRQRFAVSATETVLAARSYGLWVTDGVHMAAWRDKEAVAEYVRTAISQGFDGISTFYMPHIDVVNAEFRPSPEAIERSLRIVAAYQEAQREGKPAVVLDNEAIMLHQYVKAQEIVRTAGQQRQKG